MPAYTPDQIILDPEWSELTDSEKRNAVNQYRKEFYQELSQSSDFDLEMFREVEEDIIPRFQLDEKGLFDKAISGIAEGIRGLESASELKELKELDEQITTKTAQVENERLRPFIFNLEKEKANLEELKNRREVRGVQIAASQADEVRRRSQRDPSSARAIFDALPNDISSVRWFITSSGHLTPLMAELMAENLPNIALQVPAALLNPLAGGAVGASIEASADFQERIVNEALDRDLDPQDPEVWQQLLQDKEFIGKATKKSNIFGGVVGLVDAASFKFGGMIASKLAKSGTAGAFTAAGAGAGIDVAAGGVGESAGRLAADQTVDVKDSFAEALTGGGGAIVTTPIQTVSDVRQARKVADLQPVKSTVFGGTNDPLDKGINDRGERTGNGGLEGVALPIPLQRQRIGEDYKTKRDNFRVRAIKPDGETIDLPIVDAGPSMARIREEGGLIIDFTPGAATSIGMEISYDKEGNIVGNTNPEGSFQLIELEGAGEGPSDALIGPLEGTAEPLEFHLNEEDNALSVEARTIADTYRDLLGNVDKVPKQHRARSKKAFEANLAQAESLAGRAIQLPEDQVQSFKKELSALRTKVKNSTKNDSKTLVKAGVRKFTDRIAENQQKLEEFIAQQQEAPVLQEGAVRAEEVVVEDPDSQRIVEDRELQVLSDEILQRHNLAPDVNIDIEIDRLQEEAVRLKSPRNEQELESLEQIRETLSDLILLSNARRFTTQPERVEELTGKSFELQRRGVREQRNRELEESGLPRRFTGQENLAELSAELRETVNDLIKNVPTGDRPTGGVESRASIEQELSDIASQESVKQQEELVNEIADSAAVAFSQHLPEATNQELKIVLNSSRLVFSRLPPNRFSPLGFTLVDLPPVTVPSREELTRMVGEAFPEASDSFIRRSVNAIIDFLKRAFNALRTGGITGDAERGSLSVGRGSNQREQLQKTYDNINETLDEITNDLETVFTKLLASGGFESPGTVDKLGQALMAYYLKMGDSATDPLSKAILSNLQKHGKLFHDALLGVGDEAKAGLNLETFRFRSISEMLRAFENTAIASEKARIRLDNFRPVSGRPFNPSERGAVINPFGRRNIAATGAIGSQGLSNVNGLPLVNFTIRNKTSPFLELSGRLITAIQVNGVNVPFYRTTGRAGKDIPSGTWLPFFGIDPQSEWINKGPTDQLKNYYNSSQLEAAGKNLDASLSSIALSQQPKGTIQIGGVDLDGFDAVNDIVRDLGIIPSNQSQSDAIQQNIKKLVDALRAGGRRNIAATGSINAPTPQPPDPADAQDNARIVATFKPDPNFNYNRRVDPPNRDSVVPDLIEADESRIRARTLTGFAASRFYQLADRSTTPGLRHSRFALERIDGRSKHNMQDSVVMAALDFEQGRDEVNSKGEIFRARIKNFDNKTRQILGWNAETGLLENIVQNNPGKSHAFEDVGLAYWRNPSSYNLTNAQQEVFDEAIALSKDLTEWAARHHLNEDESGNEIFSADTSTPFLTRGPALNPNGSINTTLEQQLGQNQNKKIKKVKPSFFQLERIFETELDGLQAGLKYHSPANRFLTYFLEGGMQVYRRRFLQNSTEGAFSSQDIKDYVTVRVDEDIAAGNLDKKDRSTAIASMIAEEKANSRQTLAVGGSPMWIPRDISDAIINADKSFGRNLAKGVSSGVRTIQQHKFLFDTGHWGIQLVTASGLRRPAVTARAMWNGVQAFWKRDNLVAELAQSNPHRKEALDILTDGGFRIGEAVGINNRTENTTLEIVDPKLIQGWKGSIERFKQRIHGDRFEKAFSNTMDSAAISLAAIEIQNRRAKGLDTTSIAFKKELADGIARITGRGIPIDKTNTRPTTFGASQGQIQGAAEVAVLFAPAYYRSALETLSLITNGKIEGKLARDAIGNVLFTGALMTIGYLVMTDADEEEWMERLFDFNSSKWLRMDFVGSDGTIRGASFGNIFRPVLQAVSRLVLDEDTNPSQVVQRFWGYRLSVPLRSMMTMFGLQINERDQTGLLAAILEFAFPVFVDILVEDSETLLRRQGLTKAEAKRRSTLNPLKERYTEALISFFGFNSYLLSPNESYKNKRDTTARRQFQASYNDLTPVQKVQVTSIVEEIDPNLKPDFDGFPETLKRNWEDRVNERTSDFLGNELGFSSEFVFTRKHAVYDIGEKVDHILSDKEYELAKDLYPSHLNEIAKQLNYEVPPGQIDKDLKTLIVRTAKRRTLRSLGYKPTK